MLALMSTSNIIELNSKYSKNTCLSNSANQIKGWWPFFGKTHWMDEKQSSTTQTQHCSVTKDAPLTPDYWTHTCTTPSYKLIFSLN